MEIVKLNRQNLADLNRANQPFAVIGKIKPVFADDVWSYTEELFPHPTVKAYADDDWDTEAYLDSPDRAVFLAYRDGSCIGQIVLKRDWNRYAFIEDICVAQAARGQGTGTALLQKAAAWARDAGCQGLALETQDNNLLACRFYAKHGFVIGAVNTMLYRNFGNGEFAVFWYLPF